MGLEPQVVPAYTSVRGNITKAKSKYEPLIIDEVKESDIMITAYGFLVSAIQINKGWCCYCREFPYALPEPESLTKKVLKKVEDELTEITEAKFAEPSPEDYKTAQKLSQRSDGSRTPRVLGQGGAPPSADNNV